MLLLSITELTVIISAYFIIKFRKEEKRKGELSILVSIPILLFIFSIIGLTVEIASIQIENSKKEILNQYDNLVDFIYCYGIDGVEEDVLEMNNTIDNHKLYYKNIWVGVFYSKEISDLTKLTYF